MNLTALGQKTLSLDPLDPIDPLAPPSDVAAARTALSDPNAPSASAAETPRRFVPSLGGGLVGRMRTLTAGVALLVLAGCATTGAPLTSQGPADPQQVTHVLSKPKEKLRELVRRELFSEHSGKFTVGSGAFGAGLKLGAEPLEDDHPLVKNTPSRAANTGGDIVWARTFWMIEPHAGASATLPIGTTASISAGFSANAKIEVEMIAPFNPHAIRDTKLALPLHLDTPMVPGQEAIAGGRGVLTATVSGRVGQQVASLLGDRITVGASAGASLRMGEEAWINVRVLELPDGLRLVALTKGAEKQKSVAVDASLGFNADLGSGRIADLASDVATDQLNAWLGANFSARLDFANGEQVVGTFLFDRTSTDPNVARAYAELVTLRAESAERIADSGPSAGIKHADFAKDYATKTGTVDARLGKINLITRMKKSAAEHGLLTSSFGEQIEYWTGAQQRRGAGLISSVFKGDRSLERELTITRDAKGTTSSYYRIAWETKNDRVTTAQDMLYIGTLAERLGALEGHEALLKNRDFLGSFDRTSRALEVYFVDLDCLVQRLHQNGDPKLQVIAAFGRAHRDSDLETVKHPERGQVPWLDGTIDPELERLLRLGPEVQTDSRRPQAVRDRHYASLTNGRSLRDDAAVYGQMQRVISLLEDLRDSPTPEQRIERFRSASLGGNFWVPLIALAELGGKDGTMVNRLEVKGLGKDQRTFTFASEGRVADPRTLVDQILRGLERSARIM